MTQGERDLLDLFQFELKFLEDGGYGRSPRTPWRRQTVFEAVSYTHLDVYKRQGHAPPRSCGSRDGGWRGSTNFPQTPATVADEFALALSLIHI